MIKPDRLKLLLDRPRSGEMNMALDEVLARGVKEGEVILRFYSWEPPTITIGYSQSARELDPEALRRDGVPFVRRLTGGGAVLHWGEITYFLAIPFNVKDKIPRGELFSFFASILSGCFSSLGIETESLQPRESFVLADCFASPGSYGLVEKTTGRKIAGSASTFRRGFFFQHGSLPLDHTHRRLRDYLEDKTSSPDLPGSAAIGDFVSFSREEVLMRFLNYLRNRFQARSFTLSPEILREAGEPARARYGNSAWSCRR